jgi:type IV pilus assembly protein PilF
MSVCRIVAIACCVGLLSACTTVSEPARPRAASSADAATANLTVGATYIREGRPDLAVEALLRAIRLDPKLADAHSTIAIAYDQLGDTELAEEHYRRATEVDSSNGAAANSYGVFLCRQNRWTDAERYFRRAVESSRYATPDVAYVNAGVCARNAGDVEAAESNFRAALTRNNTSPDALTGLMDLSFESGDYLRARAFMQRYTDVHGPSPYVLSMCIRIENALDNPNEAENCAAQLRSRFPESPEAARL